MDISLGWGEPSHITTKGNPASRFVKCYNTAAKAAGAVGMMAEHPNRGQMTIIRTAEPYGTFRVTYDVLTAASAEQGDYADCGWLDWLGQPVDEYYESAWDLRDLLDKLEGCYAEGDGDSVPRWITLDPQSDFWLSSFWRGIGGEDAESVTASVHRPGWITDASWLRVCRLLGWRRR